MKTVLTLLSSTLAFGLFAAQASALSETATTFALNDGSGVVFADFFGDGSVDPLYQVQGTVTEAIGGVTFSDPGAPIAPGVLPPTVTGELSSLGYLSGAALANGAVSASTWSTPALPAGDGIFQQMLGIDVANDRVSLVTITLSNRSAAVAAALGAAPGVHLTMASFVQDLLGNVISGSIIETPAPASFIGASLVELVLFYDAGSDTVTGSATDFATGSAFLTSAAGALVGPDGIGASFGASSLSAVPEPGTAALMFLGLGWLHRTNRRIAGYSTGV